MLINVVDKWIMLLCILCILSCVSYVRLRELRWVTFTFGYFCYVGLRWVTLGMLK
ncbi:hypothetical protein GLOIN_2v1532765 [Rhizophagus irregularis DAOM 181602=DAOM 197198]|uniref:Uncharacterized protein n=1 Tax=Rhizophagus irregularis (strain DAOM 181602 / DAOM 197198 / MUCL 43194) TaxID=747089 RepID=A0A2P4QMI2_RHIID|nr:hypothetical protein GLOIN_2v1532765 [Rhizophagus irregularis DAOM 181602=DAOM 197198]POG78867.1 hypothetical protein GLOIN_2v1532765 [Rhizophagus irregularis DAOM 181602=DAOM 197198]|eukprot:XP_025185733.1 hypothetical protein GLOIN_2v1532765 [Rhizophagus irregularis DAOM 181602=DAOM 197198]